MDCLSLLAVLGEGKEVKEVEGEEVEEEDVEEEEEAQHWPPRQQDWPVFHSWHCWSVTQLQ